ncbi:MAG: hypothetical protein J6D53_08955, partial [Blautia sp.]|nr:hypothetical protein [Blautia sp.]
MTESELYRELGARTKRKDEWETSIPYVSSLLNHESIKIQAKALWLLENSEEVLHHTTPFEDVTDLLCDRILPGFSLFELLAEGIKALVVFGLVLRDRGVLPDHLLDHAVEYFHTWRGLLMIP